MPIREKLTAVWKFCLSFRKAEWKLNDYPVVVREMKTDLDFGDASGPFELQPYSARIVNWWALSGDGNTAQEAVQDLAAQFDKTKADWLCQGKTLPRPGTNVPIEFAPSERVRSHPELTDDFIKRVLELEWAFVSDSSSLWDFNTGRTKELFYEKIKDTYGVDVSDIESGNLAEILDRIALKQRE